MGIIIPSASEVTAVEADGKELTRQQRRLLERGNEEKSREWAAHQQLRVKDLLEILPSLVPQIVDPALSHLFGRIATQQLAITAMTEIMVEKLNITEEDMDAKFAEIVERVKNATPNSPALAESQEASEGSVARLDEVPPVEESAARRLVD
jgi:hypothetical protein